MLTTRTRPVSLLKGHPIIEAYFPTRYDSAAAELIGTLSDVSEGYGSESTGSVDAPTGYVSLVTLDSSCDLDWSETSGNYPHGDYAGELGRMYGVTADQVIGHHVVISNDQGFVTVESYPTAGLARESFDCLAGRYAQWSDDDDDDAAGEGDGTYVCPVIGHGYHTL